MSDFLDNQKSTVPCNHLVEYETDLGGRSVFLRTKESFAGCFPLDPLLTEDAVSPSELSSVRSERSVNSRSAGVDMVSEDDATVDALRITGRSVTVGNGTRRVGGGQLPPIDPPPPPRLTPCVSKSSSWRASNLILCAPQSPVGMPLSTRSPASTALANRISWMQSALYLG